MCEMSQPTWFCQLRMHQPGQLIDVSKHKQPLRHQDTLKAYVDPRNYFSKEEIHWEHQTLQAAFLTKFEVK